MASPSGSCLLVEEKENKMKMQKVRFMLLSAKLQPRAGVARFALRYARITQARYRIIYVLMHCVCACVRADTYRYMCTGVSGCYL